MTSKITSFEDALKSLERTVEKLESGDLSLEESLEVFEQGVASAGRCQQLLNSAANKVELLLKEKEGIFRTEQLNQCDTEESGEDV